MKDIEAFSSNAPERVFLKQTKKLPWGLLDVLDCRLYRIQVAGTWLIVWRDGTRIVLPSADVDYIVTRPMEVEHKPSVLKPRGPRHDLPPTPQDMADRKSIHDAMVKRPL